MSALRPQPARRRWGSRFRASPVPGRYARRAARPGPLRLVLFRVAAPVARTANAVVLAPVSIAGSRLNLVFAPRIDVSVTNQATGPGPGRAVVPVPAGAPAGGRLVRSVSHLYRHLTRIERSELTLPAERPAAPGRLLPPAAPDPVVQQPPRMVPAHRPAPEAGAGVPVRPGPAQPAATAPAWRPPDPAALTDGVLRELDRRIVAERERLGRLG